MIRSPRKSVRRLQIRRLGLVDKKPTEALSLKGQVEKHFGNIHKFGFLLQNVQINNRSFSLYPSSFEFFIYNMCIVFSNISNMNTD